MSLYMAKNERLGYFMKETKKYYAVRKSDRREYGIKLPVTKDRFEEIISEAYHSETLFVVNTYEDIKEVIIYE